MIIKFYKYQGTGNDFVILDNRDKRYDDLTTDHIQFLCDRRFGIGADGLMLLNLHADYDFEMTYYNADGCESSMCGNGGRCLTKFAADIGMNKDRFRFLAVDGLHEALINEDGTVSLKMNNVQEVSRQDEFFILNTGSPHYVRFKDDVSEIDVKTEGGKIRYSDPYKAEGINVNFVTRDGDTIVVRTYERGVEDETYSCGTGVTAAALVSASEGNGHKQVQVHTKGGPLSVQFDKQDLTYSNVWLTGPATAVFQGEIIL